jgi:site-specific DNA recombinase
MFQFLGLMAELEKSTIADRMNGGRDTVVRVGKWTNGPVPFGYVVDAHGCLAPSEIVVHGTGMTEAEIAHAIFERMANGDTGMGVCRWLNALGVPTGARYSNGKKWALHAGQWKVCRIGAMIRRPLYTGRHTFKSRLGTITRDVPALVSQEMQAKAIQVMEGNAKRASRESRVYILTGVLRCAHCGLSYVGWMRTPKARDGIPYYRCGGYAQPKNADATRLCNSKAIPAGELEPAVLDASGAPNADFVHTALQATCGWGLSGSPG